MKFSAGIKNWCSSLFRVWRREFWFVFHDPGVLLFFFALPLFYPLVYTLIYNPELVKDIPIAVVDDSRTPQSRELTRMLDATDAIKVYDYAPSVGAARRLWNSHEVFGILHIPYDYARSLGRSEQAHVVFYSDMALLLRYRAFVSALTNVQLAAGSDLLTETLDRGGLLTSDVAEGTIKSESFMLGDVTQGFASFVIPGILVLILQQSLILGVTMLAGGSSERRRRNGGIDPLAVAAPATASVLGKTLCYFVCYIPMVLYVLHIVPEIFSLPHVGNVWHYLLFITPMMLAASFLGMCIGVFVTEREASLLVVVFTSVVFLFLSGLTWPRYAMNPFWSMVGDLIPATWGVEGFITMNSNGSTLSEQSQPYKMLWILSALYFVVAAVLVRIGQRRPRRAVA